MAKNKKEIKDSEVNTEQEAAAPETAGDTPDGEGGSAAEETVVLTGAELAELKSRIDELKKNYESAVNTAQRTQADFANFKRRNQNIVSDSMEEGKITVVKAILPVLDDFDRALGCENKDQKFFDGVVLVHRRLMDSLGALGLSEIECSGKFDPEFHEAVLQEEDENREEGDIILVLRKGYKLGERIIRHSMVKVAK